MHTERYKRRRLPPVHNLQGVSPARLPSSSKGASKDGKKQRAASQLSTHTYNTADSLPSDSRSSSSLAHNSDDVQPDKQASVASHGLQADASGSTHSMATDTTTTTSSGAAQQRAVRDAAAAATWLANAGVIRSPVWPPRAFNPDGKQQLNTLGKHKASRDLSPLRQGALKMRASIPASSECIRGSSERHTVYACGSVACG